MVEGRWELMKLVQGGCENLKSSSQVLGKNSGRWGVGGFWGFWGQSAFCREDQQGWGVAHPTDQGPAPRLQPLPQLPSCFLPRLLAPSAPFPDVATTLGGACPLLLLSVTGNARNSCLLDKSPSGARRSNLTPPLGTATHLGVGKYFLGSHSF